MNNEKKQTIFRISSEFSSGLKKKQIKAESESNVGKILSVPQHTNRLGRVMTPVEAERKNRLLYGNISISNRVQAQRSKRLKARRTFSDAPAPKPLNVSTNGISGIWHYVKKTVIAHIRKIDFVLLILIVILASFGIIAVHSGSMNEFAHRRIDFLQIASFAIGLFGVLLLPAFDISTLFEKWKLVYIINVGLLVVTLLFGYSPTGEENNSWINLGFTSIQPAEFSKVLFIISLSAHLEKIKDSINKLSSMARMLLHGFSIIGLVLAEKDWGNTLVFIVIFVTMVFCAGINLRYIFGCIALAVAAFPIIWDNLGEFRKRRVLIGFNPELDPQGYGHQVIRSRNAISSGGLFGQGYLQGETIHTDGALFAQHTDMVYAVIGQEFGFVGCALLIAVYVFLVSRILYIAGKAKDYSGSYICCGVAGMLIFQFIINIGMALGISPVVGITLPLVSYGASSLIAMYSALALVMAVYGNSNSYSYRSI